MCRLWKMKTLSKAVPVPYIHPPRYMIQLKVKASSSGEFCSATESSMKLRRKRRSDRSVLGLLSAHTRLKSLKSYFRETRAKRKNSEHWVAADVKLTQWCNRVEKWNQMVAFRIFWVVSSRKSPRPKWLMRVARWNFWIWSPCFRGRQQCCPYHLELRDHIFCITATRECVARMVVLLPTLPTT